MDEEYEFTLGGNHYRVTRRQFEERLIGVAPQPIRTHFVETAGQRYPVKQAVAIGLDVGGDRSDFISQEALRILRKLGYKPGAISASSDQKQEQKQEFILGGTHYRLARQDFERRLAGVEPARITKHAVEIGARCYPVKQAVSVGLGVERLSFTTMDAFRILRKLGFRPASCSREELPAETTFVFTRGSHGRQQMNDRFWAYENWVAEGHGSVIHYAGCGHCKDGTGQKGGTDEAHGRWLGPYSSANEAETEARKSGGAVRPCKACQPI